MFESGWALFYLNLLSNLHLSSSLAKVQMTIGSTSSGGFAMKSKNLGLADCAC